MFHRQRALLTTVAFGSLLIAAPIATQAMASEPRIIGGQVATTNPGALTIGPGENLNCSGSLIAPTWVLTAGHCITADTATQDVVRYGSLDRTKGIPVAIQATYKHPKADLGLVKLATPITSMAPVKLTGAGQDPAVGATLTAWGWGQDAPEGPASAVLKVAQLKVFKLHVWDGVFAKAIGLEGIDGTPWKGDSGGPAFLGETQVGVCSKGIHERKMSAYTSIAVYRQWITDTAGV